MPSKSRFTVEIPSLGINVSARINRKDNLTIIEFPMYAFDLRSTEAYVASLPGIDWTTEQVYYHVSHLVKTHRDGVEEGRREVRDQVLRSVGLHDLRVVVDSLTDKIEKLDARLDASSSRSRTR